MNTLALTGALALGAMFGYGAQRGAFCMNSGFRSVFDRDWTKVKALSLAVGLQLIALPALVGIGLAHPMSLPFQPVAAASGGFLFGLSMRWAGACAAGVWYKLGAGDLGALLALLGMAVGATASEWGPVAPIRTALQRPSAEPWTVGPALSVVAGAILLATLSRSAAGSPGAWTWRRTGVWLGVTASLAWPVSAAAGRGFGLAVVPGTAGILSAASGRAFPAWDVVLVMGILMGGWLGGRQAGPCVLRAPEPAILLKRFSGGLGLGIGASIAAGCTVGQGLTGLALLAPSSFVVMGAIFAGSALSTLMSRLPRVGSPDAIPSSNPR